MNTLLALLLTLAASASPAGAQRGGAKPATLSEPMANLLGYALEHADPQAQKNNFFSVINEDDAFASIANYLRDAGWKRNVPWGVPVYIPATLNRAAIQSRLTPPRCPAVYRRHSRWLTVAEWRALGVVPTGRALPDTELAALMETPGAYAQGYLLTTNYRAILDYNCSNFYALGVGLLANAIAER